MLAIETEALTKRYGRTVGIESLDLTVEHGSSFGFLGPNGAGKTTTIRLLLDLIRPTSGHARIFGMDSRRRSVDIRKRVGYLAGEVALYERLSGWDLLRFAGSLRGGLDEPYVRLLADRLAADLDRPIRTLSQGNRRKIALLHALFHRPDLIVLDEPTQALDPIVRHELHGLLAEALDEGRTIFLSSHNLDDVERSCDRVGMVRDGRLLSVSSIARLKERVPRIFNIEFGAPPPPRAFAGIAGVRDVRLTGSTLRCAVVESPDALVKAAARFDVVALESRPPSLEDVFLSLYERGERRDARARESVA